ncbi:MAG: hypothetical protein U5L45_18070 [Saprospiraceae bacterium]|nr:hypothetical protein [Saprospiraceae bacterium]
MKMSIKMRLFDNFSGSTPLSKQSIFEPKNPHFLRECFFVLKNRNHLVTRWLRSRKEGEVVRFSGFARKMNHIPPFARAKRARKPAV